MRLNVSPRYFVTLVVCFLILLGHGIAHGATAEKVALVVGIGDYNDAPKLTNPITDAIAIAQTLKRIGFDVIQALDVDRRKLDTALESFASKASQAKIALVYFAGHGVQVGENSFLLTSDSAIKSERDLRKLVNASHVLEDASQASKLAVVILDACRDNPFTKNLAEAMGASRSAVVGRGLSRITDVPRNTLVAYSTQAGNIALDGSDEHSPYAKAVLKYLPMPNKDIRMVFGSIRDEVLATTKHAQEPFTYGSLGGDPLVLNAVGATTQSTIARREEKAELQSALTQHLPAQGFVLPRPQNDAPSINHQFAVWRSARTKNDWNKVKQLAGDSHRSLYGLTAEHLLTVRSASHSLTVEQAIKALNQARINLDQFPASLAAALQKKLAAASYYGGKVDGKIGNQTRKALRAYSWDTFHSKKISARTILSICEFADSRDVSESLSGTWKGRYFYPRAVNGITSVKFSMNLVLSQARISGSVIEPNTFGQRTSKKLFANFSGTIYGNKISWTKKYDGTAGVGHSVKYSGTIDRRNRRIDGTWKIKSNWKGRFFVELRQ